jgi:transposase-like protein
MTKLKAVTTNVHKMSTYQWTGEKVEAALMLAEGYTYEQVAKEIDKTKKTIYRWMMDTEFSAEVDRLSLMCGIASKAERLRLAKRIVRAKSTSDIMASDKDILDWLKFAQSETDGANLNLAGLLTSFTENAASVAPEGSRGDRKAKTK